MTARLLSATFGTEDLADAVSALELFCDEHLGSALADVEFVSASVGLVFGLRLRDGNRLAVKVHRSETSPQFLAAMQTVQRFAAARDFPCPVPLLGPTPLGAGLAVAESMLVAEERPDGHRPVIRRALAQAFAELVLLCRDLDPPAGLHDRPLARLRGALWPAPHDLRFDFEATADGAEWIDEIASRAAEQRDSMPAAPRVVGHSDWSSQNVRFHNGVVAAVYDWDSVALEQEAVLLGGAAHAFSADWSVPRKRQLPTAGESLAFIADYEAARGAALGEDERRVAFGALVYSRAYAARCAHSDAMLADDTPGNTARSSLRAYERLLEG